MHLAYLIVTFLAAIALAFSASATLLRYHRVLANMSRAGVPDSWLNMLGLLKAAGAIGLVVGIGVPVIGIAAAVGVTLFFVGAIVTHLRAHWYSFTFPAVFLLLAAASLGLRLASW